MLLSLALLAVIALGSVEADVGWDNPLAVFQSWQERDYRVGDAVFVDIEVYNKTQAYDPLKVECELGFIFTREVTVRRLGVGQYRANFTILEGDGDPVWVNVWVLEGEDILSGDYVLSLEFLELARDEDTHPLVVEVVVPDHNDRYPLPGQVVEFEASVYFEGTLVDPDEGYPICGIDDLEGTVQRVSIGRYTGACTVPTDLLQWGRVDLVVGAVYTHDSLTYGDDDEVVLFVDRLSVWVNVKEANERWAELDFYVTDMEGGPAAGANVSFLVSYYNTDLDYKTHSHKKATDEAGKASFHISFYDLYSRFVTLEGYVKSSSALYQRFKRQIDTAEPSDRTHSSSGLSVHLLNELPVKMGTPVRLEHEVYWDGTPLANGLVYVYISGSGLRYKGQATTDGEGLLNLTFTTPVALDYWEAFTIEYQAESGGRWDYDVEGLAYGIEDLRDQMDDHYHASTTMDVSNVQQGEVVTVTMDDPAADGTGESAWVVWSVGPIDLWETRVSPSSDPAPPAPVGAPEWSPWFAAEHDHVRVVLCTWTGDAYEASFPMPMFIPATETIFVLSKLSFRDGTVPAFRTVLVEGLEVKAFNNPPSVHIGTPANDGTYGGELVMGGTAADDVSVELVEIRIDGGEWTPLEGRTSWSHVVNTTTLERGPHVVEARAFDGEKHSAVRTVTFFVDQPPTVTMSGPPSGGRYHGSFEAEGTASDDGGVTRVEYRLDHGPWESARGTDRWDVTVDLTDLVSGEFMLEVRSFDGHSYSRVTSVSFVLDRPPTVTVTRPGEGDILNGTYEVAGRSHDDFLVVSVTIRIDGGEWMEPDGKISWRFSLDTVALGHGDHHLEVRSDDGNMLSEILRVSFSVDQPPTMGKTSLDPEGVYGGQVEVEGTAFDDHRVELVQVRIDGGEWQDASGAGCWTYALDTTALEAGGHRLDARAFDGVYRSAILRVAFTVDQPPSVTIGSPLEGSEHEGVILVHGDFQDDMGVRRVELRVDGGEWVEAKVRSNWTHALVLEDLEPGGHIIEVRGLDDHQYSPVVSVNFFVKERVDDTDGGDGPDVEESPGSTVVLAVLCLMAATGVLSAVRVRR